ncbi:MAG: hypothetical protein SFU98_11375 [Leptospiraceae bacterium]|nr:hypothetical protein [Leptospiraceae bacterium]
MQNAYILTGYLKSPTLIELDESVILDTQKVRIILETIQDNNSNKSLLLTLNKIQAKQESRNYNPPSKETIDSYVSILRNDWS